MTKNNPDDLKSVSDLILNYSLTYLDTKYLKGFRLVCKNWNKKLSPKVFEYLNLIPYSDTAFWRRYKLYYFTPSEIYISTLVKALANYLHNTKIIKISGRFSLNLPTYLNLHFNSVTCMHLNNTTICLTIFSQLTHCLPKLRELRIKNVILEMDSDWELDPKPLLPKSLKILNINTFHDYFDFPKDLWFSKNYTESLIITNNAQSILIPFYSKIDSFREFIWKRRFEYGSLGQFESTIDHNPQLDTISLRYHSMLVSTLDNIVSCLPWKKQTIRLDRIKLFANYHTQLETPIYFEFGNLINLTEFKLCFTPMISLPSIHSLLLGCKKLTNLVLHLDEITQLEVDLIGMNCSNLKLLSLGAKKFNAPLLFKTKFQCQSTLEQLYLDNLEFNLNLVEFKDKFPNMRYFSIFNEIERSYEDILRLKKEFKASDWSSGYMWRFEFGFSFSCIVFNPLNLPKHYNYYSNTIDDLYL